MKTITIITLLMLLGPAWASGDRKDDIEGDCNGYDNCDFEVEAEADADARARADGGDAYALGKGGSGGDGGDVGDIELDNDVETGDQNLDLSIAGPTSTYIRTEAVRVAPAFGTNCYEAMNASLLDKGFSIGSANAVCQSLQIVDVWFALAAVTEDPILAAEYTGKGMKLLNRTTKLVHRKLAWNNVKSFFQEVGVPVGIIALLL